MSAPSDTPVAARRGPTPAKVLAVGLLVSTVGAMLSAGPALRREQRLFQESAAEVGQHIARELVTPLEGALSVAVLFEASSNVTESEFHTFVAPTMRRHPSISAMVWAPRVAKADRTRFVATQQLSSPGYDLRQPNGQGALEKATSRPDHFPILYVEPHSPNVPGLDIAYDEERRRWIQEALAEPDLFVTPRYDLPLQRGRTVDAVAAYAPVYGAGARDGKAEARKKNLRGIAVTVFRLERTLAAIVERYPIDGMDLVLSDTNPAEGSGLLYSSTGAFVYERKGHGRWSTDAEIANRRWRLELHGQSRLQSPVPFALLGLGVMLTLLGSFGAWLFGRWETLHRAAQLGQYLLTDKLGEGGMGTVYKAQHQLLRRPTAVKIIRDDHTTSEQAIQRFEREVHAASQLRHPNSIVVYDFGRTDGTVYYAMELVPGLDLRELVKRHGPLLPSRVVHITRQICGALSEAHQRGMVHRDMKPANVMLTVQGTIHDFVKVLDFGLVLVRGGPIEEDTKMVGTPHYMAPEQVEEPLAVGPATDTYAVGCVMHYLLTGKELFERPTSYAVCLAHKNDKPLPMSMRTKRHIPESLEAIVMTCLSKNPEDRPLASELDAMLEAVDDVPAWTPSDAEAWWRSHSLDDEPPASVRVPTKVLAVDFRRRQADTREIDG